VVEFELLARAVERAARHDAVRAEVVSAGHLAVLPASDVAVIALGGPGARLVDKRVVNERAATVGLSVATEMSFSSAAELRASAGELAYPIVVKPAVRTAHGLTSAMRADNRHDLDIVPADAGTLVVQPLLAGNMRAVAGVVVDGRLVAAVHQRYLRIWPRSCGVACAAETVVPDEELERRHERERHRGLVVGDWRLPPL